MTKWTFNIKCSFCQNTFWNGPLLNLEKSTEEIWKHHAQTRHVWWEKKKWVLWNGCNLIACVIRPPEWGKSQLPFTLTYLLCCQEVTSPQLGNTAVEVKLHWMPIKQWTNFCLNRYFSFWCYACATANPYSCDEQKFAHLGPYDPSIRSVLTVANHELDHRLKYMRENILNEIKLNF